MSRIHSCAYITTPRAARSSVARSARCMPDTTAPRKPGAASTLPTVEPNAGSTLRITDLRICQMPERLMLADLVERAALDRDLVVEGRDMQAQRAGRFDDAGEARAEFLERQHLIVDLDRRQRLHAQHHFVHDAEQTEARTQHAHQVAFALRHGHLLALRRDQLHFGDAGGQLRDAGLVRGLRQGGHRHGAQGDLAHFGRQRQLLAALGERLDQRADAHAGLRAHAGLAEFQNLVERAGVDRGAAVAADAAGLRVIARRPCAPASDRLLVLPRESGCPRSASGAAPAAAGDKCPRNPRPRERFTLITMCFPPED